MRAFPTALVAAMSLSKLALAQPAPAESAPPNGPPPALAPSAPPPAQPGAEAPTAAPAPATPAPAQPAPEPDLAAALAGQRDALGRACDFKEAVAVADLRYVACGDAGVWVVRVRANAPPMTLDRRDFDGHVLGFFVQDGKLWVQIATVHARPWISLDGQAVALPGSPRLSPAPAAPSAAPPALDRERPVPDHERPPRPASVVEQIDGYVMIDVGTHDGMRDGDHVAFYGEPQDRAGAGPGTLRRRLIAVGKVDGIELVQARVRLGLNERVPPGSRAERTAERLTASPLAPPRADGLWEVGFIARPFLVLDHLGAGVFADARVGHHAESGLHVEAMLSPAAIATAEDGAITPAAGVISASYDAHLFEVGLGVGGQTVNDTDFGLEAGTGITLLQRVRLGARDGLHLEGLSYVALFHREFEFSSLRLQAQIPLSRGTWLLAAGSGGSLGIGHGELGLRILLDGNGDVGSFFLTATIGGVHVFEQRGCDEFGFCDNTLDYSGPLVGVGGEWRL